PETVARWDLATLVQALQKACHGVGYAHSHNVIHRDLKPANILLGNHGEVLVVDWGIARLLETRSTEDGESGLLWSQTGEARTERVRGSPPYMAPEQIQHPNQVTPAADVFCLGVILYEALTGLSPFPGKDVESIVRGICHGRPVPPRERTPERSIPAELEEICLRALEKFPGHRFSTATELAEALAAHLSGGRRKEAAGRRLRDARSMGERLRMLSGRINEARRALERENQPAAGRRGPSEKEAFQKSRAQLVSLQRASDGLFSEAIWALHRGLSDDPDSAGLKEVLGEIYSERLSDAERRGATREMALFRGVLRSVDENRWERWLSTGCEFRVRTIPEGQPLELLRLEERSGRLRPTESLGLVEDQLPISLPQGRYALGPALPSGETESISIQRRWIYPFVLERKDRCDLTLDLRGEEAAGAAFAFVPGGPAIVGGDREAAGAGEDRQVELAPFALARLPVTVGAYDRFLAALRSQSPALAKRHRPLDFDLQRRAGIKRPVVQVSLADAKAYVAWLAGVTRRQIRLPGADEWEKAVRGGDGRAYPWGNRFDPTLCASVANSQPAEFPPPAGSFHDDRSVFGVLDGAGGVWEWTADSLGEVQLVVGGSTASEPSGCRSASRRGLNPESKLRFLGFRVLMDLSEGSPTALD
ncbi:MAG: bifunctional serine/threonine-protein kinase/formylglycine-generating enzyme family protein, partial [Myxococcota bacterium]|nr:bifunctional serine/threonine-protein kinase/formylglycine-generating enzyme family protein [Myxococcota bacterium]